MENAESKMADSDEEDVDGESHEDEELTEEDKKMVEAMHEKFPMLKIMEDYVPPAGAMDNVVTKSINPKKLDISTCEEVDEEEDTREEYKEAGRQLHNAFPELMNMDNFAIPPEDMDAISKESIPAACPFSSMFDSAVKAEMVSRTDKLEMSKEQMKVLSDVPADMIPDGGVPDACPFSSMLNSAAKAESNSDSAVSTETTSMSKKPSPDELKAMMSSMSMPDGGVPDICPFSSMLNSAAKVEANSMSDLGQTNSTKESSMSSDTIPDACPMSAKNKPKALSKEDSKKKIAEYWEKRGKGEKPLTDTDQDATNADDGSSDACPYKSKTDELVSQMSTPIDATDSNQCPVKPEDMEKWIKAMPPRRDIQDMKKRKKKKKVKSISENDTKPDLLGYKKWEKFDADEECDKVDEASSPSESSECETDEEADIVWKRGEAAHYKDQGNQYFKEKKYDVAAECYTRGLNCDHKNSILLANRAMALIKLDKFQAAEIDCTVSIEINPTYLKAYLRRGTARLGLNKLKEALLDFKEVLERDPGNNQAAKEVAAIAKLMLPPGYSQKGKNENALAVPKKPARSCSVVVEEIDDETGEGQIQPCERAGQTEAERRRIANDEQMFLQLHQTVVEKENSNLGENYIKLEDVIRFPDKKPGDIEDSNQAACEANCGEMQCSKSECDR